MSGAPEKRHTVRVLAAAGLSTRRACRLVGTSRSHLAYEAKAKDDAELLAAITEIRRRKPRWGVHAHPPPAAPPRPRREPQAHRAHLARAWLHAAPAPARRKIRSGAGVPVAAAYRNHVWTYDFIFDATASGRTLKVLTVLDEFTRVALAVHGALSITARSVKGVLAELFARHGASGGHPVGQRPRVRRLRARRVARGYRHRHLPHRAGQALAERLRRVLPQPPARRVPQRARVLEPRSTPACCSNASASSTTPSTCTARSATSHPKSTPRAPRRRCLRRIRYDAIKQRH